MSKSLASLLLASIASLAMTGPGFSQTDGNSHEKLKISAVAGQEISLQYGLSLEKDCTPNPVGRMVVVKKPAMGELIERVIEVHSSYGRDTVRFKCNEKKYPAVAAYYKAHDGKKGIDRFRFGIVYSDGTIITYDVEATIWR